MSYRHKGNPITDVKAEHGVPTAFTWNHKVHLVEDVAGRRRIDDRGGEQRVWQDRFRVAITTGELLILIHDLLTDSWFILREYD